MKQSLFLKNAPFMSLLEIDTPGLFALAYEVTNISGCCCSQMKFVFVPGAREYKQMPKSRYLSDQPATYRIRVYGTLDAKWSRRLGDMHITHPAALSDQTVLTGKLTDQAELFGVLNSLYALGYYLLLAEHLEAGASTNAI